MGRKDADPSRRIEYVPRSPKTATRVHKIRKYEIIEESLDEEIEAALRRHENPEFDRQYLGRY